MYSLSLSNNITGMPVTLYSLYHPIFWATPIISYIFSNLPYMPYILGKFIRLVGKTSLEDLRPPKGHYASRPDLFSMYAKMLYLNLPKFDFCTKGYFKTNKSSIEWKNLIVIDHQRKINLPNVVTKSLTFVVIPYICPISALYFHVVSPILSPIFWRGLAGRPDIISLEATWYVNIYIPIH